MRTTGLVWLFSVALTSVVGVLGFVGPAPGQPFEWQAATPASQGMSKGKLDALKEELAKRKTHAFLVIRNDKIVYEWYAAGYSPNQKHGAASLSKATVTGLALALLLGDGKLQLDTPVAELVPAWKNDDRKRTITLRHLGSHTSGLADAEQDRLPHAKLTGWKGDFWKQLDPPNDPFTLSRDEAPVLFEPGTGLQYSNPGIAMVCYAVTAALKDTPATDVRTLLRDRVLRPIGVGDAEWSIGYGKTFRVDGLPLVAGWGGGSYTARAVARIGRLVLREGDWDGKQILGKGAVRQITGDAGLPGDCGMGFWTNADGRYARLPRDTYYGAGAGDQLLIVVPSLNLIVVRYGESLAPEPKDPRDVFEAFHDARVKILFEPIVAAITDRPLTPTPLPRGERGWGEGAAPYPPSKAIVGLTWAPKAAIVRKAKGSDNWPLTWADDDRQYTAYGDGWGFEPLVPTKLGLGFARVEGEPLGFKGKNIRSPTGEQVGDGAKGKKASGILCVGGVLYLWTRNASNAQLAWSKDHGQTWAWADWRMSTNSAVRRSSISAKIMPAPVTIGCTSTRPTRRAPINRQTAWCWRVSRKGKSRIGRPTSSSGALTRSSSRCGRTRSPAAARSLSTRDGATALGSRSTLASNATCGCRLLREPKERKPTPALKAASAFTTPRSRGDLGRRFISPRNGTLAPAKRPACRPSG
jgi:CubicO group peptidase (beta-lactamase class C family)